MVGAAVMELAAFLDRPTPKADSGEVPLDAPVLEAPVEPEHRARPAPVKARPTPAAIRRGAGLGVVVVGLLTMTYISLPALSLHLLSARSYLYGGYGLNGVFAIVTGFAIAALGGAVVGAGLIGLAAVLSGPGTEQETDSCPLDSPPDATPWPDRCPARRVIARRSSIGSCATTQGPPRPMRRPPTSKTPAAAEMYGDDLLELTQDMVN